MSARTKQEIVYPIIVLIITVGLAFLTSGCGNSQVTDDLRTKDEQLDARLGSLEQTVAALSANLAQNIAAINLTDASQATAIASLQQQANAAQAAITSLQLNVSVVGLADPCGDGPGYDEVGMQTSDGRYIFYFEDGAGHRHLTVLTEGVWYQTTDEQACTFRVVNHLIVYQ